MSLVLLLKYLPYGAIVALLGFGLFELHERDKANVAKGQAEERARVADSTLKALRPQLARVDTIYRRDTVHLTRTIAQTITLRDTLLQHLTDTLRVKEFIAQTDSTVHACIEASNSCATNLRLKDREIAALNDKLGSIEATLPVRHWWSDRIALGPYAGIDQHGKGSVGGAVMLSVFRFP